MAVHFLIVGLNLLAISTSASSHVVGGSDAKDTTAMRSKISAVASSSIPSKASTQIDVSSAATRSHGIVRRQALSGKSGLEPRLQTIQDGSDSETNNVFSDEPSPSDVTRTKLSLLKASAPPLSFATDAKGELLPEDDGIATTATRLGLESFPPVSVSMDAEGVLTRVPAVAPREHRLDHKAPVAHHRHVKAATQHTPILVSMDFDGDATVLDDNKRSTDNLGQVELTGFPDVSFDLDSSCFNGVFFELPHDVKYNGQAVYRKMCESTGLPVYLAYCGLDHSDRCRNQWIVFSHYDMSCYECWLMARTSEQHYNLKPGARFASITNLVPLKPPEPFEMVGRGTCLDPHDRAPKGIYMDDVDKSTCRSKCSVRAWCHGFTHHAGDSDTGKPNRCSLYGIVPSTDGLHVWNENVGEKGLPHLIVFARPGEEGAECWRKQMLPYNIFAGLCRTVKGLQPHFLHTLDHKFDTEEECLQVCRDEPKCMASDFSLETRNCGMWGSRFKKEDAHDNWRFFEGDNANGIVADGTGQLNPGAACFAKPRVEHGAGVWQHLEADNIVVEVLSVNGKAALEPEFKSPTVSAAAPRIHDPNMPQKEGKVEEELEKNEKVASWVIILIVVISVVLSCVMCGGFIFMGEQAYNAANQKRENAEAALELAAEDQDAEALEKSIERARALKCDADKISRAESALWELQNPQNGGLAAIKEDQYGEGTWGTWDHQDVDPNLPVQG